MEVDISTRTLPIQIKISNQVQKQIFSEVFAELQESDQHYLNKLKQVCIEHLERPELSGREIYEVKVALYEDVESYSELVDDHVPISQIELYIDTLHKYFAVLDIKGSLNNLFKDLTSFLYEKTLLEQSVEISKFLQNLGNVFLKSTERLTSESYLGLKNQEVCELSFTSDEIRKSLIPLSDLVSRKQKKVSSGYSSLDNVLQGGFESSRVYVFCGKPGHGKSSLLLNLALNASRFLSKDQFVVYITLENDVLETTERLLKIHLYDDRSRKDVKLTMNQFSQGIGSLTSTQVESIVLKYLSDLNIIIKYFPPKTGVMNIFSWLNTVDVLKKVSFIVIDYLSLMKSTRSFQEMRFELGQLVLDLKEVSRKFNVPVVTAAQVNTQGYEGIPDMRNVDESRQIVQHSDFIALLYDPNVDSLATTGSLSTLMPFKHSVIGINVDKNRTGPRGRLMFYFLYEWFKFVEFNDVEITVSDSDVSSRETSFDEILEELTSRQLSKQVNFDDKKEDNYLLDDTSSFL